MTTDETNLIVSSLNRIETKLDTKADKEELKQVRDDFLDHLSIAIKPIKDQVQRDNERLNKIDKHMTYWTGIVVGVLFIFQIVQDKLKVLLGL